MSRQQDPLAVYALWTAQAAIMEEQSDQDSDETPKYEPNMKGKRRERDVKSDRTETQNRRLRDGNGNTVKQNNRRARIVLSDSQDEGLDDEDMKRIAAQVDEIRRSSLPNIDYRPDDSRASDGANSISPISTRVPRTPGGIAAVKSAVTSEKKQQAQEDEEEKKERKKSWSKRAFSRTKDIFALNKEPSALAFEEFRNREFKKAGVKPGDNPAAKLHVSSQKLPPEAISIKSSKPPPLLKSATETNTAANKLSSAIGSPRSKSDSDSSTKGRKLFTPSIASSSSRNSSILFGGSQGGYGGEPHGKLKHHQTDGPGRASTEGKKEKKVTIPAIPVSAVSGLDKKQKAAAIDDRW